MIGEWTVSWAKKNKIQHKYFKEITSTNNFARNLKENEFYELIVADTQTAGRGRGSNTWTSSKPGTQLLSSWVFDLKTAPQPIISPLMGLGIYKALKTKWAHLIWNVKAPNDIYLNDKKVGGILIETITIQKNHRVIVGVGINVSQHPNINNSGDIQSHLPDDISSVDWESFLNRLHFEIKNAVSDGVKSKMNGHACQELCNALNLNPRVKVPYEQVLPDGSLRTKDRVTPWSEI